MHRCSPPSRPRLWQPLLLQRLLQALLVQPDRAHLALISVRRPPRPYPRLASPLAPPLAPLADARPLVFSPRAAR
jgi:hypothetical protein